MDKKIPLGHVELEDGPKAVYATNDLFLNFMFDKKENWETLRLVINIFLKEFNRQNPGAAVGLIKKKEILVETQYMYLLNAEQGKKVQDFKLDEISGNNLFFAEFQNSASSSPPVKARAMDYRALGTSHSPGKISTQIWLMAEDIKELLGGEDFASYSYRDSVTGRAYPVRSVIMFVSLQKLSKRKNAAGDLASFLLGKNKEIRSGEVKRISKAFKKCFKVFRKDKEVKNAMTYAEHWKMQARLEGREEGREEGIILAVLRTQELLKAGYSIEEALKIVLGENKKQ